MALPTLIELAEAGAHFGHHRSLTYPKAKGFVYAVKSNVALINLEKTQSGIEKVQSIIHDYKNSGKTILFVGTKRSVRNVLKEAAESIQSPYIIERWFGGMLTNFETMHENIKRMNELEEFLKGEKAARLSKKERLVMSNRLNRYHRFLGGVTKLNATPDLIVLASASEDKIAIREANQLGIPVAAITDTDMNPERITYPIPANDDAPRAVEMILRVIVEAPSKVSAKTEEPAAEEKKPAKKAETKAKAAPKKAVAKKATKAKTATKSK